MQFNVCTYGCGSTSRFNFVPASQDAIQAAINPINVNPKPRTIPSNIYTAESART